MKLEKVGKGKGGKDWQNRNPDNGKTDVRFAPYDGDWKGWKKKDWTKKGDKEKGKGKGKKGDRPSPAAGSRQLSKPEMDAIHKYLKDPADSTAKYCWQFNGAMGCTIDHGKKLIHACIKCGAKDHGAVPQHGEPQ